MNKKPPIYRTCILSRKVFLKEEMFRLVKKDGEIYFDKYQNMMGRGYYIFKDINLINKAKDKHSLSRLLKSDVKEELYLELIENLKERR